jgi:cell division protease FtsH
VSFSDFMRDVEAGKIEKVTITGQEVSGIYRADKETFHTYAPAQYEGLADGLDAKGILIGR